MGISAVAGVMLVVLTAGVVSVHLMHREPRPTHIVLLVLDTVRADRLGCYGADRDTTPFLDEFAAQSVRFEHARAPAPWTLPSHASLFTGLVPSQHGCTFETFRLDEGIPTLAEQLRDVHGFRTIGVTSNVNVARRQGLDRGFEAFDEVFGRREQHRGLDDTAIALELLRERLADRKRGESVFTFVNLMDAHLPYSPPPPYDTLFGPVSTEARALAADAQLLRRVLRGEVQIDSRLREELVRLYDGELRQLDQRVRELVKLLEAEGMADDAWWIVTSDHGEMLGEDGLVDHQLTMREEVLRVPLFVRPPRALALEPLCIPQPVSLVQVFGWVEDMARGRLPLWTPAPDRPPTELASEYARPLELLDFLRDEGLDPSPYDRRRVALAGERAGRWWKFEADSAGETALHALVPGGDRRDFSAQEPQVLAHFQLELRANPGRWRFLHASEAGELPSFTAGERAELIRLGYLTADSDEELSTPVATLLVLARQAAQAEDWQRVVQYAERAVALEPEQPDVLYGAATLMREHDEERAREFWLRFLDHAEADDPRREERATSREDAGGVQR